MRILVIGADGYIGKGVVKNLLDEGNEVIAVGLKKDGIDPRAIIIEKNIFELENPYEYLKKPDCLLHLAWRDGFIHNSETHMLDLSNHYRFLSLMMDSGIKRIAVMGSMHEVGRYEGRISEKTPCNPTTLYGIAKNTLREALFLKSQNTTDVLWLRGFYIVSNDTKGASIFSRIAQAVTDGKREFPFTLGRNRYDFLDYEEFCAMVVKALLQEKYNGIINICSGKPIELRERVESFIKENKYNIKLKYGLYPERSYDTDIVYGDNTIINEIMEQE